MKKLFLYFIFFFLFFYIEGNSAEISPVKQDFEEIFNFGKMLLMMINLLYIFKLEIKRF